MMGVLIAGIAGLALLDSLNPATIVAITLILLTGPRRPILSAMAFVIGAALPFSVWERLCSSPRAPPPTWSATESCGCAV